MNHPPHKHRSQEQISRARALINLEQLSSYLVQTMTQNLSEGNFIENMQFVTIVLLRLRKNIMP